MTGPAGAATRPGAAWAPLIIVFGIAFGLRLAAAVALPNIHHPDEIFQSLEQAYRAVFGYGIVPWEFRDGARSWLLPGLLAGPMWLGNWLAPGTGAYRVLALALVAALTASTASLGYAWGRRFGEPHAVLAAVILATWFELVYFGAKAFAEVIASCFLFAGVFAASARPADARPRRAFLTGVLLSCAFVFRFHLAPAIALAALWHCRAEMRNLWLPLLAGAAIPLAILGLTDWMTWSIPFGSIIRNFTANILEGRSQFYGVSPTYWYLQQLVHYWGVAAVAIVALAVWGARRDPLPVLAAAVIVLAHSVIAHKEYRFIYPALPLLLFSAALGSAECCRWIASVRQRLDRRHSLAALAIFAWLLASLALATSDAMRPEWSRGRGGLEAMSHAGMRAQCGVALEGIVWAWTGGYSSLHRNLPVHELDPRHSGDWNTRVFDAWIAPRTAAEPAAAGFERRHCYPQHDGYVDDVCLWTRTGPCEHSARSEIQRAMEARGE